MTAASELSAEVTLKVWLRERYEETQNKLLECVLQDDENVQVQVMYCSYNACAWACVDAREEREVGRFSRKFA